MADVLINHKVISKSYDFLLSEELPELDPKLLGQ